MAISNFTRGDTRVYNITVVDKDGAPYNLTGHTDNMTMKDNTSNNDTDPLPSTLKVAALLAGDPTTGQATVTLDSTDTDQLTAGGKYFYDFQVASGDATPIVTTIDSGNITVVADVTRLTT